MANRLTIPTTAEPELRLTHLPRQLREPDAALDLLRAILTHCEYNGVWTLRPMRNVRWSSNGRFKLQKALPDKLVVRVQPGDGGTCWEWEAIPPSTYPADIVARELELWNGYDGHQVPQAVRDLEANRRKPSGSPARNGQAPTQATPASPPDVDSLTSRLQQVDQLAKPYRQRAAKLSELQQEYERLLAQAAEIEQQLSQLRTEHETDDDGRKAIETLDALRSLFT